MDKTKLNVNQVLYRVNNLVLVSFVKMTNVEGYGAYEFYNSTDTDYAIFDVPIPNIISIDIFKNYDEQIYPLVYLSINVPLWFYKRFYQDYMRNSTIDQTIITKSGLWEGPLAYFDMDEIIGKDVDTFYTTPETAANRTGFTPISVNNIISGRYIVISTNINSLTDIDEQIRVSNKLSGQTSEDEGSYAYNEYAILELTLYNVESYIASYVHVNNVISEATLLDMITYIFIKVGITNVVLSPPTNRAKYKEMKILPQSAVKNLLRLIDTYKFHERGTITFFDLDYTYIIEKSQCDGQWTARIEGESPYVQILSISKSSPQIGGEGSQLKSTIGNETNSLASGVQFIPDENLGLGTNIMLISQDSFIEDKVSGAPSISEGGYEGKLNNVFIINTRNALMSVLTPNKIFKIYIDGSIGNGTETGDRGYYRLKQYECVLTPRGEYMFPEFNITLIQDNVREQQKTVVEIIQPVEPDRSGIIISPK